MLEDDPTLFEQAEALLGGAAVPERDWEALAQAVEERVATTPLGSTPATLLAKPFEEDETDESAPEAPVTQLAELARSVAQQRSPSDVSGLALESLSVAARLRAQGDTLLERVRSAPLRPPVAPPPAPHAAVGDPSPAVPAPVRETTAAPPSAETAPAASGPAPLAARNNRRSAGLLLAAATMVLGGAALLIVLRQPASSPEHERPVEVARPDAPTVAPPQAAQEAAAKAPATTPSPAQHAEATELEQAAPADALAARTPEAQPAGAAEAEAQRPAPAVAPRRAKATPRTSAAPQQKVALAAQPEKAAPSKTKAPPSEPAATALRPAAATTSGLPQKPPTGAVQAAVGSVLASARACVAGSKSGSNATVVFASSGNVKSVVVTGPAANTPAEACIRSALGRARVEPFAATTFSVNVSVRP